MYMWKPHLITACLIITLLFLGKSVKPIHWRETKQANKQLLIQIALYTVSYLLMVSAHYSIELNKQSPAVLLMGLCALNIATLIGLLKKVPDDNKIPVKTETAKPLLKIVAFTWYGIFSVMCGTNYSLIVLFPNSYKGLESLSFSERAFNAVYYTFSIMFTYSGNGIASCDVLSRSVEIIEVLCCYIFIGIIITNVIGKAVDQV